MDIVISVLVIAMLATVILWWQWVTRRQEMWRLRLIDAIPGHSAFWRTRRQNPGALLYTAVGDSAAQGIGASRPAHAYVGFLAKHIEAATGAPVRVANLATSGATVRIAIDSQLPALAQLNPDVLTVCIGANDMANFDASRFASDIEELFAALPSHAIVADLPSFYFLPRQKHVRIANRIVRDAAARHHLTVAPLHARTHAPGLWAVLTQFSGDLFHPNDRGYRVWAAAFEDAVDARLSELEPSDAS